MKKFFLCSILTFAGSLTALAADAPTAPDNDTFDAYQIVYNDPWFVRHSVIIVLLLLFLAACVYLRSRRRPLEIFSTTHGRIHVTPGAMADLVESAALQYGAVSRPRVLFKKRRGQIHLYVRLKLGPGQRLPLFSSGLQMQIMRAVQDAFGIENLGGVHLIVTGFKGRPLTEAPSPIPYHGAGPANPAPRPRAAGEFFER
jgi:hypothetical protein